MTEWIYDYWLKLALRIGVPYDTFWKLNPKKLLIFIDAFNERKQREIEEMNTQAWLAGIYVAHAVGANLSSKSKYPEQPIDFNGTSTKKTDTELKAAQFGAFAEAFNKRFKKDVKPDE